MSPWRRPGYGRSRRRFSSWRGDGSDEASSDNGSDGSGDGGDCGDGGGGQGGEFAAVGSAVMSVLCSQAESAGEKADGMAATAGGGSGWRCFEVSGSGPGRVWLECVYASRSVVSSFGGLVANRVRFQRLVDISAPGRDSHGCSLCQGRAVFYFNPCSRAVYLPLFQLKHERTDAVPMFEDSK